MAAGRCSFNDGAPPTGDAARSNPAGFPVAPSLTLPAKDVVARNTPPSKPSASQSDSPSGSAEPKPVPTSARPTSARGSKAASSGNGRDVR